MKTPWARDEAVYIGDNGAVYCGRHLGASARWTGFDLSGAAVDEVTPAMVAEWEAAGGDAADLRCEVPSCGRAPQRWQGSRLLTISTRVVEA